jgi:hypothetical protein
MIFERNFFESTDGPGPGIVDPNVDPAELTNSRAAKRLDVLLDGNVGRHHERLPAQFNRLCCDFGQHLFASRRENDGCTGPRKT